MLVSRARSFYCLEALLPMRIFLVAINGCSVNRQLSMTPAQPLSPHFFLYWRQAWVDCHSPLENAGPKAKTEDYERAVTSAMLLPYSYHSGARLGFAGVCLRPQTFFRSAFRPKNPWSRGWLHVVSMTWRGALRLSRPKARRAAEFLAFDPDHCGGSCKNGAARRRWGMGAHQRPPDRHA